MEHNDPELLLKVKSIRSNPAIPPMPEGKQAKIPENEATPPETINFECKPLSQIIGTSLFMTYDHGNGNFSERRLTIQFVYHRENTDYIYIRAWCHETEEVHTFYSRNIIEVIDPATNEVIQDRNTILEAFALIAQDHEPNMFTETYKAIKKHNAALNVLKFIACCDDHYSKEEEVVIIEFLRSQSMMKELDEEILLKHIRRLYPDRLTYYRAVDIIAQDKTYLTSVLDFADRLAQADGCLMESESQLIKELEKEKKRDEIDDWIELELTSIAGIGPIKIHT